MKLNVKFLCALILMLLITNGTSAQTIPYDGHFGEINSLIKSRYLDSVNIDSMVLKMVNDYLNQPETINKILTQLDPHSYFFNEEEYNFFKEDMSGSFSGVGLVFRIFQDTVFIVHIIEGGPAEKAGIKTGDRFLAIDNEPVSGNNKTTDDIFPMLRGGKGTDVKILVYRGANNVTKEYTITRDQISLKSIEAAYMLDKKTGYIRLNSFTQNSDTEIHSALMKLNNAGMEKLVLDLRNNTGGYFKAARHIADEFLSDNKLIVYTEGFNSPRSDYYSTKEGVFENGKMVLLVNGETASSAEILTGALQDQKRAVVIGTRTYGKGLIQQMYTLADSVTALKLTTSKYYTPSGRCIQRSYSSGFENYIDDFKLASINSSKVSDVFKDDDWGIHPDIFIQEDTTDAYIAVNAFVDRNYIQDIAFQYYVSHTGEFIQYRNAEDLMKNFNQTELLYSSLIQTIKEKENELPEEERIVYTDKDLATGKLSVQKLLKAYLAYEIWGNEGLYQVKNSNDPDITAALQELSK